MRAEIHHVRDPANGKERRHRRYTPQDCVSAFDVAHGTDPRPNAYHSCERLLRESRQHRRTHRSKHFLGCCADTVRNHLFHCRTRLFGAYGETL